MFDKIDIKLSDKFNYSRLLRFALPSIVMVLISSVYGVVDGVIVSNYTDVEHFAALNLILPYITLLGAAGLMLGTGGSALVGKILGEGKSIRANGIFSLLTYTTIAIGLFLGLFGYITSDAVANILGADETMQHLSFEYSGIIFLFLPCYVLQLYFQSLLTTAERPSLALQITLLAGITNIALDILFVIYLKQGLRGAAYATGVSQTFGGLLPLLYFILNRKKSDINIKLGVALWDLKAICKSCVNGLSEWLMSVSLAIVSFLYYYLLLTGDRGEMGVDTYGVLLYFSYIFIAVSVGFSRGIAPVISYHYGASDRHELHSLLMKGLLIVLVLNLVSGITAQVLSAPLANIFVGHDKGLYEYTVVAFRIYSIHFFVTGFNIYISSFFTALNNGKYSGWISVLRTICFESISILTIWMLFGVDKIWWGVTIAEFLTMVIAFSFLFLKRNFYGY